jgi:multisubunit Na+/H+ antiporter MnhC subunit
MIPALLIKLALIIIMGVSIYKALKHKHLLDILYYVSIVLVALHYYISHFGRFLGLFP